MPTCSVRQSTASWENSALQHTATVGPKLLPGHLEGYDTDQVPDHMRREEEEKHPTLGIEGGTSTGETGVRRHATPEDTHRPEGGTPHVRATHQHDQRPGDRAHCDRHRAVQGQLARRTALSRR